MSDSSLDVLRPSHVLERTSARTLKAARETRALRPIGGKVSVVRFWTVLYTQSMSTEMLEQKIVELQQRVETLEARMPPVSKGSWRDAIGFAKDDELFREAMRLGAEWREQANREGR